MTDERGATAGTDVAAVRRAGSDILDARTRREAADRAVAAVEEGLGAEYVCAFLWNDSPDVLLAVAYSDGVGEWFDTAPVLETPAGPIGAAMEQGSVVVETDVADPPVIEGFAPATGAAVAPVGDHGALVAFDADGGGFSESFASGLDLTAGYLEAGLASQGEPRDLETDGDSARMEALSRAFPDYAFLYDGEGRYLDVLLGWTEIQLYNRDELVGATVYDILDTDLADDVMALIEEVLSTGEMQMMEYSIDTPGGTYWYEGRVAPVTSGDGDDRVAFVARDITERYERERDLERQNERLDEFASIVSHDLRNPLTTANGYLEMARAEIEDEDVRELLSEVDASHDRMGDLIEDLLSLARQGRTVDVVETVDVEHVANRAWEVTAPETATLVLEDPGSIVADGARFRQLLENLFRNAVEHGDGAVTVTVERIEDGLAVTDDGPGIPAADRERVFESGVSTSGTGLGLTIVSRIVDAHGWEIAIEEGPEGGARFELGGIEFPSS